MKVFLFLLLATISSIQAATECNFTIPDFLPRQRSPIYLTTNRHNTLEVFVPTGNTTKFRINESIYLYCEYGFRGNLATTLMEITCENATSFANLQMKTCQDITSSDTFPTNASCAGRRGVKYQVGYNITTINGNIRQDVFEVCFNSRTYSTIYTSHVVNGKAIMYSVRNSQNSFRVGKNIYKNTRLDALYHDFKPINFNWGTPGLQRAHFTPNADFVFSTERYATYVYINAAPMFGTINNGNWRIVENKVRCIGNRTKENIHVVTGTFGAMKNNNLQELYLDQENKVIAVPEMFWKVAFVPRNSSAVVFITLNNISSNSNFSRECPDNCERMGLNKTQIENFRNKTRGLTICCLLSDFRQNFSISLPPILDGKSYNNLLVVPKDCDDERNSQRRPADRALPSEQRNPRPRGSR
ncbi:uncharacterized protein LOC132260158 [Phlebotomus argentipes]|uniref:uncharacterized protein LOC132260158 n=1 Tax=Phlebotomus argentipes TaxID=94469 RepID=UPI0028931550|nr:uncharacterized protein LOC132260158 [Phlebotomus argentipes]